MDDFENPLLAALRATPPEEPASEATPPLERASAENPLLAALAPQKAFVPRVLDQAARDKWGWERLKSGLEEVGADPEEYGHLKKHADLAEARRTLDAAEGKGVSTSQAFRRSFMGYSSLTSLNFLPDVQTGGRFFGGRVVGDAEYQQAARRFEKGEHTPADLQTIAVHKKAAGVDKSVKSQTKAGGTPDLPDVLEWLRPNAFATKLLLETGSLGKIGVEAVTGGQAAAWAGGRVAAAAGYAPKVAAAGQAPLVPLQATYAGAAASKLLPTLATPSLYVPIAQQNNLAVGRDANDWKGFPTAYGYGYANMLVLGQLQKGLKGESVSGRVADVFKKGVLASAEIQGVDGAAGLADEFLPKAYKVKPTGEGNYGTLGSLVQAGGRGDSEKFNETLRDATIQALSFSAFAAMHGRETKGNELAQAYADAVAHLRDRGFTPKSAAEVVGMMHDRLEAGLSERPYMTREEAREYLRGVTPKSLDAYSERLADAFEPKPRGAEPLVVRDPNAPDPAARGVPVKTVDNMTGPEYYDFLLDHHVPPRAALQQVRNLFPDFNLALPPGPSRGNAPPQQDGQPPVPQGPVATVVSDAGTNVPTPPAGKVVTTPQGKFDSGSPEGKFRLLADAMGLDANLPIDQVKEALRTNPGTARAYAALTASETAPAPPPKAPNETPRQTADRLEAEWRVVNEQIAKAGAGTNTAKLEASRKRIARDLKAARDAAILFEAAQKQVATVATPPARQPNETVATVSKAPGVPQDATRFEPAVGPARTAIAPPEAAPKDSAPAGPPVDPIKGIGTRAQQKADAERLSAETGRRAHVVDLDIDNMKGLVEHAGPEIATALSVRMAETVRKELNAAGGEARLYKSGTQEHADEYSVIVTGLERSQIEKALAAAEREVASLAARRGIDQIPHAKAGRKPGVGVTAVAEPLEGKKFSDVEGELGSAMETAKSRKMVRGAGPVTTVVTGPASENPNKAVYQLAFDRLEPSEQKRLKEDNPALYEMYKDAGVDVDSVRHTGGKTGPQKHEVAGVEHLLDSVGEARNLTPVEATSLRRMLSGESLKAIGNATGVSHETIRKAAERALAKMKASHPDDWGRYDKVQDVIAEGTRNAAATGGRPKGKSVLREFLEGEEGSFAVPEWLAGKPRPEGSALYRWFWGDLPELAKTAKRQELDGPMAAALFDVASASKDFKNAIRDAGKNPRALTDAELALYDDYLRVPLGRLPGIERQAAEAGVPTQITEQLLRMRRSLDRMSDHLVSIGAIPEPLVATVVGNKGFYVHRMYKIFDKIQGPKWAEEVRTKHPEIITQFTKLLTDQVTDGGKRPPPSAEWLEGEVKRYLWEGTAAGSPIEFLARGRLGAKDLSILKDKNGEIPPELRALWGEVRDPLYNYAGSVVSMMHLATTHNFLRRVATEGYGKIFFRDPEHAVKVLGIDDPRGLVKIAEESDPAMRPLAGLTTTPEVLQAFRDAFKRETVGPVMRGYMKLVAGAKMAKIIFSHTAIIRNFLSNPLISIRNGHFSPAEVPKSVKAMLSDSPANRQYYGRLVELGVLDQGVAFQDFRKSVEDATGGRTPEIGGMTPYHQAPGRIVRGLVSGAERAYKAGDNFWKVFEFENELKDLKKAFPKTDSASLEVKAAEIVTNLTPTYSRIAPGLQKARRGFLFGPFIAFQAEIVRTTKNAILQAVSEINSGNPHLKYVGYRRLAGMAAAATIPLGLAAATAGLFGVSDKEEKAIRQLSPEWEKESRYVYFGRDAKGQAQKTDFSKVDPHAYLADAVWAVWRADNLTEGAKAAARELARPFTSEELLVKPLVDVARNQKEQGGHVTNPANPPAERGLDYAAHFGEAFVPGAYGPLRRLWKAWEGSPEQKSGKTYDPAMATQEQVTGQRVDSIDRERELLNRARAFDRAMSDAARNVNELTRAGGVITPAELQKAGVRAAEGRKKALEELRKDVDAVETLGLDRAKVVRILRDGGLSQDDVAAVLTGIQKPYLPALKGSATERVRAAQVRTQAASSPPSPR